MPNAGIENLACNAVASTSTRDNAPGRVPKRQTIPIEVDGRTLGEVRWAPAHTAESMRHWWGWVSEAIDTPEFRYPRTVWGDSLLDFEPLKNVGVPRAISKAWKEQNPLSKENITQNPGYYDEIAQYTPNISSNTTDTSDTDDDDYPKRRPVYVGSWLVAVIEQYQAEGLWGTRERRVVEIPRFLPITVEADIYGETVEEAIDAVYREIEIQAPEFMTMHLGKADIKVKFTVVYTYIDHDNVRREMPVCHLHRDSATDHWATDAVTELVVEAPRTSMHRRRTLVVPRRLWGRDKDLAEARVLAYVDGALGYQEHQSPKLALKEKHLRENLHESKATSDTPTVAKALNRLEQAVEYGESAMRWNDYQDMVSLSTAISAVRHTLRK